MERHDQNGFRPNRHEAERDLIRDLRAVESAVARALEADVYGEDDALMQLESLAKRDPSQA